MILRLDGDVKRRDGFVADDEFRSHCERPGDSNPLALPAGEFMRVSIHHAGVQADGIQ